MTQEIKPTYATFEQAKWLKEKKFKGRSRYYGGSGELVEVPNIIENDYRHTNNEMQRFRWEAPEQHQVVEWLRVNHGIWVYPLPIDDDMKLWQCRVIKGEPFTNVKNTLKIITCGEISYRSLHSPQEAYSAAFDYIKNKNLI